MAHGQQLAAYSSTVLHIQCRDSGQKLKQSKMASLPRFLLRSTFPPNVKLGLHHDDAKSKASCNIRCSSGGGGASTSGSSLESGMSSSRLPRRLNAPPFIQFQMSDFDLCTHVSVGLSGRGDEVVFEAIVRNPQSPLNGSKVVIRQLAGPRAQRWGKRALQVITKLVRRQELFHSYATQVHGYVLPAESEDNILTLVHGYNDSYSLHHQLLREDWLPTLEAKLSLHEEGARRVGDGRTGGPTVSRQHRLIQILMRDILIGVNYIHSHGLAHTDLKLQNLQVSERDRHVKVGILGNAADFVDANTKDRKVFLGAKNKVNRRQLMIAFDIRCAGLMLARMVLRELMDPEIYSKFKVFLAKGNDPAGLREFLLPIINQKSPSGSESLQILDRYWGAGWNLLSLMLAKNPSDHFSCAEALRHPFLCGPRWRVVGPSMELSRWSLGTTAIRIVEEYMYSFQQRKRLAQLVSLLEMINPNTSQEEWLHLLPGRWRLLYHTGRQVGLTYRKASPAVLMGNVYMKFHLDEDSLTMTSNIDFCVMPEEGDWDAAKQGMKGSLEIVSGKIHISEGERLYEMDPANFETEDLEKLSKLLNRGGQNLHQPPLRKSTNSKRKNKHLPQIAPSSLPIVRLNHHDIDIGMNLDYTGKDMAFPVRVIHEARVQVPSESFDISKVVCGTYIDARLLVLRGVSGAALLFIRSPLD